MITELGFGTPFNCSSTTPLLYTSPEIGSTVKHVALRYFFTQELVKEGRVTTHYVNTENQLADLGAKHTRKQRQRHLLKLISEFRA